MEGKEILRGKNPSQFTVNIFLKFKEGLKLVKNSNGGYQVEFLIPLWVGVVKVHMQYFTLDEWFITIYGYYFSLLNHYRHKLMVLFPSYLLSSLETSIKDHNKKQSNLFFIVVTVEHYKVLLSLPKSEGHGLPTS